jgi:hypothetical protein
MSAWGNQPSTCALCLLRAAIYFVQSGAYSTVVQLDKATAVPCASLTPIPTATRVRHKYVSVEAARATALFDICGPRTMGSSARGQYNARVTAAQSGLQSCQQSISWVVIRRSRSSHTVFSMNVPAGSLNAHNCDISSTKGCGVIGMNSRSPFNLLHSLPPRTLFLNLNPNLISSRYLLQRFCPALLRCHHRNLCCASGRTLISTWCRPLLQPGSDSATYRQ